MEESNLSVGGHVLFAHYQQGMTDYLAIALLHHSEGVAVTDELDVTPSRHLDLGQLHLAARINVSEWQNNKQSKQYISFIKGKNGKKVSEYFRDFIGCQEGVDGPGETRTLLKAFSDFVESEDLPEDSAREKTKTLVDYASSQAKLGEPMGLEELSELIDEERPKAFYDHIRNKDYGLSPEIPADKRTLNQFRRFTGRAEGLSISFEAHLLGSKIEYDEENGTLIIKGKNGKKVSEYFRDFIGCQEGVDGPGETRTLLKAFSDFVESEDLPEDSAREKTKTLVDYASSQAKLGEPMGLEELSELIDEERPKAFYDHIRNKDYGLSLEIPADKRTLNQFRRFTGRAEGLSISFEAHLLGSKIEYDEENGTLIIKGLPTSLTDQLKRRN